MNERIKQLAEQANIKHDEHNDVYYNDSYDGIRRVWLEKFAELIVRECIDIAYKYDAPKMSGPGMIIGNRIEEHFGVEE
jgi:hypothetical protein